MKTSKAYLILGALAGVLAVATPASATIYINDFSGIGPYSYPDFYDGPYSQGGITIQYMGSINVGGIWTTYQSVPPSDYSWYPNGGGVGYDAITLSGGGAFNTISLTVGDGGGANPHFAYQLLNGSNVVGSGYKSTPLSLIMGSTFSFSGAFTEVDVQAIADGVSTSFNPVGFDTLDIGKITISTGSVPGPVPGAGLAGLVGLALALARLHARRRHS